MPATIPLARPRLAIFLRRLALTCFACGVGATIAGCAAANSSSASSGPASPTLNWSPTVSSVPYGSPLTTGVLDAVSDAPGSFAYTTSGGQLLNPSTILAAGSYTFSAAFTPDDPKRSTAASISIQFHVGTTPANIAWTPSAGAISAGVPLVPAILDATGNVNGSMAYTATSSSGVTTTVTNATVLPVGAYTLTASFTPSDSNNFGPVSKSILFSVSAVSPAVNVSSSAALEQGYNGKFVIDTNGTAYLSVHSADGTGNLSNALVQSVGLWNQNAFSTTYLRNVGTVNVESSPQGAASIAASGDGTVHLVWSGSDTPLSDSAHANQIHYARFLPGNPPGILEESVPLAISGFSGFYTAPFTAADIWQEHPSAGEDSAGNLYIAFEGRDAHPPPPPTCSAPTIAAGAAAFRRSSMPLDNTPPVSVSVAPASISLLTCAGQQFTATVNNTPNTFVNWQVNGIVGGTDATGTINAAGFYVAPAAVPTPSTVTITADSQADPTKTASAVVTVNAQPPHPTTGTIENGIALLTRSKSGSYSESGVTSSPAYLSLQGYSTQLRPQILVQSLSVQHVVCTGSGPGIAHQQVLYGKLSAGNFSGWLAVRLSQNDQQNQRAALDSQGQVHLVWREVAAGQPSVIYYSVRTPGGVWSQPQQISTPGQYADTPTISVDDNYVRVAWVEWQPGFINSAAQLNNGLDATGFNDTHIVEGKLMFSMKSQRTAGADFIAPAMIQTPGVVSYPTFSQGVSNALAWTAPSSGSQWSVNIGQTP